MTFRDGGRNILEGHCYFRFQGRFVHFGAIGTLPEMPVDEVLMNSEDFAIMQQSHNKIRRRSYE